LDAVSTLVGSRASGICEAGAPPRSDGTTNVSTVTPAAAPLASTESVSVLVHAGTVAIVVRDPAVSAQEALHCAFETAAELTGRRRALRSVTLNGRTLYQQQKDLARSAPTSPSTLAFAC
jgi:hypothetical protein